MKKNYISRHDSIVLTAIDILDQLGIQGLTIREIANRQSVTEAAIYRHFTSKQEIILEIINKYAMYDNVIMKTIREQDYSPMEGIRFLVKSLAEYYENYPEITTLMNSYELFRDEPLAIVRLKEINDGLQNFFVDLLQKAKSNGDVRTDIDSLDLYIIFRGYTCELATRWRIEGRQFSLKEKLLENLDKLYNKI